MYQHPPANPRIRQVILHGFALWLVVSATLATFQPVQAAAVLTVTPITWNVMGLDSNDVTAGPNNFPVGVRIYNASLTDTATNVNASFIWDTTPSPNYIDLRPGSYGTSGNPYPTIPSIAPGGYVDVYFEVQVTRNSAAYDKTRRYHVAVTADGGVSASSPTPREIYVEHLISQSRNTNFDVKLNGITVPVGGEMNLYVGQTYTITLESKTATNGYEQIESFINFPNTIFKINSVISTYSAVSGGGTTPTNKLYNDACTWINDPNNPNYRSCAATGKAGGNVVNTYNITILSSAANGSSQTLTNLVYDFSGSSYHYNSDSSVTYRIANIIDPASVTIAKSFNPATTAAGGSSVLTLTLHNPNPAPVSGANFTDRLPNPTDGNGPGILRVASPANATTSGCGTPTFTYTSAANYDTLSFSNGSIAANGDCVIKINVALPASPTTGTYNNTTGHLYMGSVDTGHTASANLTLSTYTIPTCTSGLELATWNFDSGTTSVYWKSSLAAAPPTTQSINGVVSSGVDMNYTAPTGNTTNAWYGHGGWATTGWVPPVAPSGAYFEFVLDTSKFSSVSMSFIYEFEGNWANGANNTIYVYSQPNGGSLSNILYTSGRTKKIWYTGSATATTIGTSTTTFRVYAAGMNQPAELYIDNVVFTGCAVPPGPTLTKAFSTNPIAVGATSTLTFTLSNENSIAMTGATFTDTLPAGLQVAATPAASTTCGGSPTWAPTAGATSLTFGSPTGATIPARSGLTNGSCTLSVAIAATTAGPHQNVSGYITTTQGGTNTTSSGYGSASLTALLPPEIEKSFSPDPILTGGTSTLTFTLTNPNTDYALSSVQFDDPLPTSPGAMTIASPLTVSTSGCGSPTFSPALAVGGTAINLRTATIAAGGTCTVKVNVTATATGKYTNTTGKVSTIINGGTVDGNQASDTLDVQPVHPGISLLKQVSTSPGGPWVSVATITLPASLYYQFTVENTGDVALSTVSVSDPTLTARGLSLAACTWASLPTYVDPVNYIKTCVVGPVSALPGSNPNTATASGTYGATTVTDTSTARTDTAGLTLVKNVTESAFTAAGDVLHYSFIVTNSGFASLQEPVVVNDNKATDETCPSTTTVGDGDAFLDPANHPNPGNPAESITCTATYTVISGDVTAGSVTNLASATVNGVTSNTATQTVNRLAADYDDLPGTYATLQSQNGARHTLGTLFMGPAVTPDADGLPSPKADADTDDGVTSTAGEFWTNGATVHINIDLRTSTFSGTAAAGIWIDWNGNGSFDPATDFSPCAGLTTGAIRTCAVTVPNASVYTVGGTLFVRVRLFDAAHLIGGGLDAADYAGLANNGEVEGYMWKFGPTAITLSNFNAHPAGVPAALPGLGALAAFLLGLLLVFLNKKR